MNKLRLWRYFADLLAAIVFCAFLPMASHAEDGLRKARPIRLEHVDAGYTAAVQLHESHGVLNLLISAPGSASAEPIPMARKVDLWRPLLEQLFRERGRRPSYVLTVQGYSELNDRLAKAARGSDRWDAVAGAPKSGTVQATVLRLLNEGPLFTELQDLFSPLGYQVKAIAAEHVLMRQSAGEGGQPASRRIGGGGDTSRPSVPGGAAITFRISRQGSE